MLADACRPSVAPSDPRPLWSPTIQTPAGEDPALRPLLEELARESPRLAVVLPLVPQMGPSTLLMLLRLPPREWTVPDVTRVASNLTHEREHARWGSNPRNHATQCEKHAHEIQTGLGPFWRSVLARVRELYGPSAPAVATPLITAVSASPLFSQGAFHQRHGGSREHEKGFLLEPLAQWPELSAELWEIWQQLQALITPLLTRLREAPRPWAPELEEDLLAIVGQPPALAAHLIKQISPLSPRVWHALVAMDNPALLEQSLIALPPAVVETLPQRVAPLERPPAETLPWTSDLSGTSPRMQPGAPWVEPLTVAAATVVAPTQPYTLRELFVSAPGEATRPRFVDLDHDETALHQFAKDLDYAPGGVVRPPEDLVAFLEATCAPAPDGTLPRVREPLSNLVSTAVRQLIASDPERVPLQEEDRLMRWLAPWRARTTRTGIASAAPAFFAPGKRLQEIVALPPDRNGNVETQTELQTLTDTHTARWQAFRPWLMHSGPAVRRVALETVLGRPKGLPPPLEPVSLLNDPSLPMAWRVELWRRVVDASLSTAKTVLSHITHPLPPSEMVTWGQKLADRIDLLTRSDLTKPGHGEHTEAFRLVTDPNIPLERVRAWVAHPHWNAPLPRRALSRNPVLCADPTARGVLRRMRDPETLANLLIALPPGDEGQQIVERIVKMSDAGVSALERLESQHPGVLTRHATRVALRPLLMSSAPNHRLCSV